MNASLTFFPYNKMDKSFDIDLRKKRSKTLPVIAVINEAVVFGTSSINGSSRKGNQLINHGHCAAENFKKTTNSRNFENFTECWSSYCSSLSKLGFKLYLLTVFCINSSRQILTSQSHQMVLMQVQLDRFGPIIQNQDQSHRTN